MKANLDAVEARGITPPRKAVENNQGCFFFHLNTKIDRLCRADVQGQKFGHNF